MLGVGIYNYNYTSCFFPILYTIIMLNNKYMLKEFKETIDLE